MTRPDAGPDGSRTFRTGLLLLAGAAVLMYLPVLAGYVPLPADIVLSLPPWEGVSSSCCAGVQHGEMGDLVTQIYPWRTVLNAAVSVGRAPLWNFHYLMGAPYQAMPQSALFFPLNWLYSIVNGPLAWSLLFIVRTALLAITTAIFVRRLGASTGAALISGFTFGFSGWITAFEGWPAADTAMWLPLMFLSVDCLRDRQSAASIALGAVAFALPVLGGAPEIAFQMILLGVLYAACRVFPWTSRSPLYLAAFGATGVLAVCLAAVQLLPTLEWIRLIPRSLTFFWPVIPTAKIIAFLSRDIFHQPNVDGLFVPGNVAYVGAFAMAALPLAWLWQKRRDVFYFAAILLFCLSMAYGWDPVFALSRHVPVLRGLPNERFLIGADFAVVVLAGLAISAIESRCVEKKSASKVATLLVLLLAGTVVCALVIARVTGHNALPYSYTAVPVIVAFIVMLLADAQMLRARTFIGWTAVLIAADLFTFSYGHIPFVKAADIFPANPAFDFLIRHAGTAWRVGAVDVTYGNNFELPYGLSEAAGYDFPTTRVAGFLVAFSANSMSFDSARLVAAPTGALDLTGTRFFVATTWNASASRLAAMPSRFHKVLEIGTTRIFENRDAVPLAFFVPGSGAHVLNNEEAQRRGVLAPDFDPRHEVITSETVGEFFGVRGIATPSRVDDMSQEQDEMRFSVVADQDGLLVFDETYYPGWKADVDGRPAPVIRADYAFMAVPLTQGRHVVRFRFAPSLFRAGGLLSSLSALLIVSILLFHARDIRDLLMGRPPRE